VVEIRLTLPLNPFLDRVFLAEKRHHFSARWSDRIVVMGSRDDTPSVLAGGRYGKTTKKNRKTRL
jgi:hypothetical protein